MWWCWLARRQHNGQRMQFTRGRETLVKSRKLAPGAFRKKVSDMQCERTFLRGKGGQHHRCHTRNTGTRGRGTANQSHGRMRRQMCKRRQAAAAPPPPLQRAPVTLTLADPVQLGGGGGRQAKPHPPPPRVGVGGCSMTPGCVAVRRGRCLPASRHLPLTPFPPPAAGAHCP